MKTIKLFISILLIVASFCCNAQQDSLGFLENRIKVLEKQTQSLRTQCNSLVAANANLQAANSKQDEAIRLNERNFKRIADTLGIQIKSNTEAVSSNTKDLTSKTIGGLVIAGLVLVLVVLAFFILRKRISEGADEITKLKDKADQLNEQVVVKLNSQLSSLQQIVSTVSAPASNVSSKDMTELVKVIADRITFMEMTLFKMDKSVKGYKQLSKSIDQMKNNLLANGYEIVDMLGKPYHDGMRVVANFVEDESLDEGCQIITGVTKPQINYNGVMIQSAQITVSQN